MANIRNSALSLKLFTLLLMTRQIAAFYLPGMGANNFKNGDKINVFANSLRSAKTEIPYNFYHKALKFPRSSETIVSQSESLGAFLSGDRLEAVEFNMTMGNELQCKQVTEKNAELSGDDVRFLLDRIKEHYYYTLYFFNFLFFKCVSNQIV
jgi:transmembrane 9 superfamily member 2/4